jgi:hypothetical protein
MALHRSLVGTGQNRPLIDFSKPATTGVAARVSSHRIDVGECCLTIADTAHDELLGNASIRRREE